MDTLEDLRAYAEVWSIYEKRYMGFYLRIANYMLREIMVLR